MPHALTFYYRSLCSITLLSSLGCGPTPPPRPAGGWYQVRAGETLSLLAQRCQAPLDDLIEANQLRDPDRIEAGQALFCPGDRGRGLKDVPAAQIRSGAQKNQPVNPVKRYATLRAIRWPLLQPKILEPAQGEGEQLILGSSKSQVRAVLSGRVSLCRRKGRLWELHMTHAAGIESRYCGLRRCLHSVDVELKRGALLGRIVATEIGGLGFELLIDGHAEDPLIYFPALPALD